MAFFLRCLFLLLVCLTAGVRVNRAAAPLAAPSPSPDCSSELFNLYDCLPFVLNGSNATKPERQCCSGLRTVVKEAAVCLCDLFSQGSSLNISIARALTLPSACHVSTPSASRCNVSTAGAPGPAPALSPSRGAPSSASTGGPSPPPTSSTAAAIPASSFVFLSGFAVVLWLYYQSH